MKKVDYRIWVGVLAVLMGGCGSDGGDGQADTASPAAPKAPATTQAAAPKASPPASELEPIVAPLPSAPDLIQSTNAEQRIKEIEQPSGQQQDPFNVLSLPPIVELPEDSLERGRGNPIDPNPRPGPPVSINPPRGNGPLPPRNGAGNNGEEIEPIIYPTLPQMEPMPPIGQLPIAVVGPAAQPPPPEIATAVTVSGVMELGGTLQAIVTAPDEPTRQVKVGDRLASGAVIVKRIEINSFTKPAVILEENGYEVARELGDKPSSEEQP
ncbi:MAG: hypothetical protein AB4352_02620 [Hormoscilla sp.]